MSGLTARLTGNLLWLVLFSATVVLGAFLTFVSGVLFDDSYQVEVPMPEAGGVLAQQEVTVLGRAVGQVEKVELVSEGVLLTLSINGSQQVPTEATVQVLRRSPIGEQAVDFQPDDAAWEAAEPGERIVPTEALVPAEIPFLLESTVELFEAIGLDNLETVVSELGAALEGRGERLKALNRDSLELNRTLVAGIPDFERLFDSSEVVLATLRDHREALAESFTNAADLTEILAENRPTLSTLLDTGTRALVQTDALIRNERANLSCVVGDLVDLNRMLLGPSTWDGAQDPNRYASKLDEAEHALIWNRFFFREGYNIIGQPDPDTGMTWTRIQFLGPETPQQGQAYEPKRATPATLPGAACETSAFGTGVNAVRQADHGPADATSPGIDFAPLVASSGGSEIDPPPGGRAGDGGADGEDRGVLPATGGGLWVLAPLALLAGLWLRRPR